MRQKRKHRQPTHRNNSQPYLVWTTAKREKWNENRKLFGTSTTRIMIICASHKHTLTNAPLKQWTLTVRLASETSAAAAAEKPSERNHATHTQEPLARVCVCVLVWVLCDGYLCPFLRTLFIIRTATVLLATRPTDVRSDEIRLPHRRRANLLAYYGIRSRCHATSSSIANRTHTCVWRVSTAHILRYKRPVCVQCAHNCIVFFSNAASDDCFLATVIAAGTEFQHTYRSFSRNMQRFVSPTIANFMRVSVIILFSSHILIHIYLCTDRFSIWHVKTMTAKCRHTRTAH